MKSRNEIRLFSFALVALLFVIGMAGGCASEPVPRAEKDAGGRENAIFACKQKMQALKKARFLKLPPVLQRLAGDNQILKRFDKSPSKPEIARAIAKFPLIGDSGGTWGDSKDAAMRTLSTRFVDRSEKGEAEMISMVFGQPGSVYEFPVTSLKGTAGGGGFGTYLDDTLRIRVLDEHHLLIEATSKAKATMSHFGGADLYAVVRTYVEQTYAEETASQLSDYPVESPSLNEETCDQTANS